MKYFMLVNAPRLATLIGIVCLISAAMTWSWGVEQTRSAKIMAKEEFGQRNAYIGRYYPEEGANYDLEAHIIGQEGWFKNAINVERGDLIEVRLRVASADSLQPVIVVDGAYSCNPLLRTEAPPSVMPSGSRVESLIFSKGLTWTTKEVSSFGSPDSEHIAYIPIGVYRVEDDQFDDNLHIRVGYRPKNSGEEVLSEIFIIPLSGKIDFRAIWGYFVCAGLACFFILVPLTVWLYRRAYGKEC